MIHGGSSSGGLEIPPREVIRPHHYHSANINEEIAKLLV
jgi:hypothetical protein